METEIKRIVKKKKPTGEEVGKTLLFMLVKDTQNSNNQNYKPTVTQAQFDAMVYSFTKEQDFIAYAFYKELYEVFLSAKLFIEGLEQQTLKGLIQIQHMVQRANTAEREKQAKELLPVIMSQQQYNAYIADETAFEKCNYETQQRIKKSGIAVMQGNQAENVNSAGEYVEPNTYVAQEINLEKMAGDSEFKKRVELLYNNVVLSSLVYIQGYNALLDILSEVCMLEELKELKRLENGFEKQIELIDETIEDIQKNLYGIPQEKAKKEKILQDIFPKIGFMQIEIPKKKKQLVQKQIQEIKEDGKTIHSLQELNCFVEKLVKGE